MIETGQEGGENTPNRAESAHENNPILPPIDPEILKRVSAITSIIIAISTIPEVYNGKIWITTYDIMRQFNLTEGKNYGYLSEEQVRIILKESAFFYMSCRYEDQSFDTVIAVQVRSPDQPQE
jgi:hypothetical protein